MAIDFTSGFMPNIKFKGTRDTELFLNQHNMISFFHARRGTVYGFVTSEDGSMIFAFNEFIYNSLMVQEVSIYEAIPKLIPDGMRYNKELDKLVPDVISASNEYCSGIKVEFEKVLEYSEEILQRENGFIKADKEKINFSLVDPYAYEDLGKCLTIGAKKYSPDNWKLGDIESYIAALDRHLIDIKKAVLDKDKSLFIDKDTTLQHGANLLCNAMFIHYFIRKELEEDKC